MNMKIYKFIIRCVLLSWPLSLMSCSWGWNSWSKEIKPIRGKTANVVEIPSHVKWHHLTVSLQEEHLASSLSNKKVQIFYWNRSAELMNYALQYVSLKEAEAEGAKKTINHGKLDAEGVKLVYTGVLQNFANLETYFQSHDRERTNLSGSVILKFQSDVSEDEFNSIKAVQKWSSVGL